MSATAVPITVASPYEFLASLLPDVDYPERASAVLFDLPGRDTRIFSPTDHAGIIAAADALSQKEQNVYLHVALHDPAKIRPGGRGSDESATALLALSDDIDILLPGHRHKSSQLPLTLEEALSFLGELPWQPTYVVHTGFGLQPWWVFREPLVLDEAGKALAGELSARYAQMRDALAKTHGWRFDKVQDLARVLRAPGTRNVKNPDAIKTVCVLTGGGSHYNPSELLNALPPLAEVVVPKAGAVLVGSALKEQIGDLISAAENRVPTLGRNPGGFWLACQLRDAGLTEAQALEAGADYVTWVDAQWPERAYGKKREYRDSVAQAFKMPPRAPLPALEPGEPQTPGPVTLLDLTDVIGGIKRRNPISLGLPHLDAMLGGGLSAGESLVVGGGPGSLKTTTMATVMHSMAGPRTAIYGVFFDEHYERVSRKIAAQFGVSYSDTEEATVETKARLGDALKERDAILKLVRSSDDPSIEQVIEACFSSTPEGRVPVFFIDHLHRLHSDDVRDADQQAAQVNRVVNAVLRATARGGIVYAVSEVTKAALDAEVARQTPLKVFADTRAIASRFDVALATVSLPSTDGEVRAEVIGTGKNRFGDGHGGYVAVLDLSTWRVSTRDVEAVRAEANEIRAAAKAKEKREKSEAAEQLVLSYIAANAPSQERGCKRKDVFQELPASEEGMSREKTKLAITRLIASKRLVPYSWKPLGATGPEAEYVRIANEADVSGGAK